jgi:hypothetical protein
MSNSDAGELPRRKNTTSLKAAKRKENCAEPED